jgi:hypothetical protein
MINNLIPVPIIYYKYFAIFLFEIFAYSIFAFLVFSKTTKEVNRRWKASVFCGILSGVCIYLFFFGVVMLGWLMQFDPTHLLNSSIIKLPDLILGLLGLIIYFCMPAAVLGTFIAYYRFESSDDLFIERYWRNPKINYEHNKNPIFK